MIEIASEPGPNGWLSLSSSITSVSFGAYYDRDKYNFIGMSHDVTGSFSNIKGGRKGGLLKDTSKLNKSDTIFKLDKVTYRVSGHTPTGYIGLVKKNSSNDKYYFCTDVSKTDKQDYGTKKRYTCCFLILKPDLTKTPKMTSRFIGRFVIEPTDITKSNLVLNPSDTSKPLYVNYSINVDVFNPEKPYLSLPVLTYGDRYVKFSYNLEGFDKRVTLHDSKAAILKADSLESLGELPPPVPMSADYLKLLGHGGTRRRNYRTSTKKSKKTKITKKRHYKNKRTSQKKHKRSRK
jgi:hypothetical protein